jgi:uncharacterized protein
MQQTDLQRKKQVLKEALKGIDSLVVAFSGGVDSALLLAAARDSLGDRVLAVTVTSPLFTETERAAAEFLAKTMGVCHEILEIDLLNIPEIRNNAPQRCYICKKRISESLLRLARERGFSNVAHGANADDLKDYRPGLDAARESGVLAPLLDAGLTKADVRELARQMGLAAWNKLAMACLASRFPYGERLTRAKLDRVGAAELFIREELGDVAVRVRSRGLSARIEVDFQEMQTLMLPVVRKKIIDRIRGIGFDHVSLDMEGYTSGSMDRGLTAERKEKKGE